ncbi:MAG: hypothetical protein Kow00121_20970 [Elainellaceae cyanobacterium]
MLSPHLRSALQTLQEGDFQARWEVVKSISNCGTEAIVPLLAILEEEETDWELLWFIARILGNLHHPDAVNALAQLLQSTSNPDVAGMAATALANQGEAAIAPLIELLQVPPTRSLALQALAQIRHPHAVPALLDAVNDPASEIRVTAIDALSHYYGLAIPSVLLQALADPNADVRKAAVNGLAIQANQPTNQLELTPHLKPLLWDLNPNVCCQTAIALGRVGTDAAADALLEVVQSTPALLALRLEAIRAMARIGSLYALMQLQTSLFDLSQSSAAADLEVSREIVAVLGRVESSALQAKATEILLNLLHTHLPLLTDLRLKQAIARSLGQLKQLDAIDALIQLLADSNASVRFHAIAALKQLNAEAAYQTLQTLSARSDLEAPLQQGIAIALQEWQT